MSSVQKTVRQALNEALHESMTFDERVILLGEEIGEYQGAYKVTQGLLEAFGPHRVMDTPISEYGFAGVGVGAAFYGLRPVVEFMSFNFSMQAIDHIINSASKTLYMSGGTITCPIVFRGPNGAAARVGAQHSQCYASWFAHCPGLKVVAPYDAASAKALLKASIEDPNPVVFLEHELLYGKSFDVEENALPMTLDKARVVRAGKDVTLVGFSFMVDLCLKAAERLASHGIDAEVIDMCVLRPMDIPTVVRSVIKTHRLVVVEEGWPVCGIGSEIITAVSEQAFDEFDHPPVRITGADIPLPYAPELEAMALPSIDGVVESVRRVCS